MAELANSAARRALALAVASACVVGAAMPSSGSAAASGNAVRGKIQSISAGTLAVTHQGASSSTPLRPGSIVREGDTVVVGPRASAIVRITVPRGRSAKYEAVYFKPVPGAHLTLRAKRAGDVITVSVRT